MNKVNLNISLTTLPLVCTDYLLGFDLLVNVNFKVFKTFIHLYEFVGHGLPRRTFTLNKSKDQLFTAQSKMKRSKVHRNW